MLQRLPVYSRFIKAEHTLFSIPLLFSGAILAAGRLPSWRLSLLILAAGFGGRTAAFALNRIVDRHIDVLNPRTQSRELPSGQLSLFEAWGIALSGTTIYLASAWAIAPICLMASPVPLLIFTVYPFLKRVTFLAHFGVGLADAMAPLGGWVAVTKALRPIWPGFWLALFTFFWVAGFDIIYATMDEAFDRSHGLHSLPEKLGARRALLVSGGLHAAAFFSLGVLNFFYMHSGTAFVTWLAVGALLYFEHLKASDVDLAFFKINAVLGFGVLGFVAAGAMQI